MKKIIFITFLSFYQLILAQDKGTVKGIIVDKEMAGEALPFANVFVKGTSIGTTSDMDGSFTIAVPSGAQTIVFSFVGYTTIEKPITILANQTIVLNIEMGASEGVELDEIEIKATVSKESASALLLQQKKATLIKESIGSEELSKKGVSNAAGAVSKISGVSKQEGSSNVYVRGLGDRYLNTTMNGLTLPSNNVNKKNIDLSLFPSDIIQNISISKAYSGNFYGDFAAGNVDITSKEYTGKGFFEVTIGGGANSRAIAQDDFRKTDGSGAFGFYNRYDHNPFAVMLSHSVITRGTYTPINASFGFNAGKSFTFKNDSSLHLFATASFSNDYEYREGPAIDFINVFKKGYEDAKEYEYSTQTTAMFNAIYKINPNNKLKFTSLFLNSSSDEVGYYGYEGKGINRDAQLNTDEGFFQQNIQFNQDLIFVNQITGEHKYYNDEDREELKLTWGVGYNNVYAHEPDRKRITLENYHYALDNDPTTNPSFFDNNSFDNQRYFQKIIDEELNSVINFTYSPSEELALNFGYNGRYKTRDFENYRYGYAFLTPDYELTTSVDNLASIFNIENTQFFRNQEDTLYFIDTFNSIPGFEDSNLISLPGLAENTYSGELGIHAAYVSADIKQIDKWLITPGVRFEYLKQRIDYDVININPNDPDFREAQEVFILPSLNIKYAVTEEQNLRFSFSKTVSVPEFKEVAPFVYEDVTERIGGNPDLLDDPAFSTVYNADLKYEWFPSRSELVSVAGFFKQIHDPVNLVIANDATGTQRYFRTGDKATIFGAELELRKNLVENSDEETQLALGFNFTYMHTEQDLKSTTGLSGFSANFNRDSDQLQGASPYLVNVNLDFTPTNFENFKPIVSAVFSYFSDRIYALGSGTGNIVEKGVPTLDFVLRNNFGENFEVTLSAKNILDPSIERIRERETSDNVTLSNYQRGVNVGLGLKYKF